MQKATVNPNSTKEKVLDQIVQYGPVSAKAIANDLEITTKQVMQRISYLITKSKVNIQKTGNNHNREYFFDSKFPTTEEKEDRLLFESLNKKEITTEEQPSNITTKRKPRGLDALVTRCHHLIIALENCPSDIIMDTFNLNEEQARILVNKVMAKYDGMTLSFSVLIKKGINTLKKDMLY